MISRSQKLDYALVSSLERDPLLKERLRRLRTVPGVVRSRQAKLYEMAKWRGAPYLESKQAIDLAIADGISATVVGPTAS
jgi:hypothetical protein